MKQSLMIWLDAARPKTLPLALVSILTGSSLAFANDQFSLSIALLAFLTATLLQILSNLANDYGDAVKGTDNENRLGPMRAMQSGAVTAKTMKQAIILNIVFTVIAGLILIFHALTSIESILSFIALGVLAIVAAIAYTVGNKPYGYIGLGDLSVFIFFGLLGVSGTYFLHTGHVEPSLFLPALGCGLMAVAVLNINNMRDIENDSECGKRTMAVRLGQRKAKHYHFALLGLALVSFALYLLIQEKPVWISLPFLLSIVIVYKHGKAVWETEKPAQIAPMMPVIVKCSLVTNLLFAGVVVAQTLLS
ncbi:1,4-dihydroxy-2-naphthoate octaprenyltransferase [Vibrio chagasii]|uniref:1,4-dihydroxy-2-naphthoate polyprenyltransferase n=1 Tax=Vibrio TaxID=662 RepID=UPI000E32A120|nr:MULTISPECIES: 1,4-dihydroxy-2-naphthoate polyprenyltransferase [Vibrio]CAH6783215.1 1,4-dihydroxy-2-naphthoate octaprenyltransferase [Vibrio chagasii]CAH6801377.1 1,4-dihydroxy-2-naphthoate octaprenyltransferase [Vibrio chagasii]CAH6811786.1 1,4-dihydroxy-2-naphthoate octaprenyltransferase [Vibrio chagasii]CAH6834652.1 1,4-dihydroxy-2-naphthoate octaprenyltransferase [Vibrio chagasii]CAH6907223.1 1,4-dihydroxy-2-naphthoate octaprenyltransferase [Vibrio chagasii]